MTPNPAGVTRPTPNPAFSTTTQSVFDSVIVENAVGASRAST